MLFLYAVLLKLSYVCMPTFIATINLDRLPEAICCCYTVIDVLLIMCLLAFFVTSADKSQLFVYLLIYCLRLFVV